MEISCLQNEIRYRGDVLGSDYAGRPTMGEGVIHLGWDSAIESRCSGSDVLHPRWRIQLGVFGLGSLTDIQRTAQPHLLHDLLY